MNQCSKRLEGLVAPWYCDTIAAVPHIARYFWREVCTPPKWCDTLSWHLVSHRHICAIPHYATYRAIIVRYPHKNKHERVLRYYRYKYRAIWKVSLLGLLAWGELCEDSRRCLGWRSAMDNAALRHRLCQLFPKCQVSSWILSVWSQQYYTTVCITLKPRCRGEPQIW